MFWYSDSMNSFLKASFPGPLGWLPLVALVALAGCGGGAVVGADTGSAVDAAVDDTGAPDADVAPDASAGDDAALVDASSDASSVPDDAAMAQICGTRGADPCPTNQFCQHDIGADCGRADAPGTCQTPPTTCTPGGAQVCGCDGVTYASECEAHMAMSGVDHAGACL